MTGVWLLCGPESPFVTDDGGGIEIRADGRWSKLTWISGGSLARYERWDHAGPWVTRSGHQLDLDVDGGGTIVTHATFSADLASMTLDNMGHRGHYAAAPDGIVLTELPSSEGDDCAKTPKREYEPQSEAEFDAAVAHVWSVCGDGDFFGDTEDDGVEIRPDGTWFRLVREGSGFRRSRLVRESGRWESIDTSSMNGWPSFQLDLTTLDGGTYMTLPVFAGNSSRMRMNNMSMYRSEFMHAPRGSAVTG